MKRIMVMACALAAACTVALTGCASTAKAADTKKADAKPAAAVATTVAAVPEHGVIYSGNVEKNSFIIADNHTYGKNFQFINGTGRVLPKDYKAVKGDVVKMHIEGSINKGIVAGVGDDGAPVAIWFNLVDTSAAAGYWKKLTDKQISKLDAIPAGGTFSYDLEFPITVSGISKASAGGADLIVGTSNNQKEAVIITTTKFTYEITRP